MTTNINFSSWDNIFMDPVIANAILDRMLHHEHVIQITGNSSLSMISYSTSYFEVIKIV